VWKWGFAPSAESKRWTTVTAPTLSAPATPCRRARYRSHDETARMSSRNTALVSVRSNIIFARNLWGTVRDHSIHKVSREVANAASDAARTETTTSTGEGDRAAPPAVPTFGQDQPLRQDPAAHEGLDLGRDERGQRRGLGRCLEIGEERLPLRLERRVEDRLYRADAARSSLPMPCSQRSRPRVARAP
jgi:hypothetical protein